MAISITFSGFCAITQWAAKAVQMPVSLLPVADNNQALLRFLWHTIISVPLSYWILAGRRPSWPVRVLVAFLAALTLNFLAAATGLRVFRPPWNPVYFALEQTACFILALLVDRRLLPSLGPKLVEHR